MLMTSEWLVMIHNGSIYDDEFLPTQLLTLYLIADHPRFLQETLSSGSGPGRLDYL
jgi:hypothetical protein